MQISLEVRPGANRYVTGEGTLKELPLYLADFKKIAVVTGPTSFKVFNAYYQADVPYPVFYYDGSASNEDAEHLAEKIGSVDAILAIGGGRVIDTSKLVAEVLGCKVVVVPTLISNCAPYTPIAAVYHPDHTFKNVQYFKEAPYLTLVDTKFLLATPKDYLVAGIGDTVAKWYEIEGITRRLDDDTKNAGVRVGIASAKAIKEILFADSLAALEALDAQQLTPAFGRIADTVMAMAGTVGGFAVNYGRTAGAHATHNGLSYLPVTHQIFHGAKVAYGVLVQLSYTKDFDEIGKILPFYKAVHLPTSVTELNLPAFTRAQLAPVATLAADKGDYFNLIDPDVTPEKVLDAIENLENFTAKN